jgi:unsaturated chondroitin disaccharide hydrolase
MASRLTDEVARDAEMRLVARIEATAAAPPDGFPHAADPASGQWQPKPGGAWTDGFWVGLLWLAHAATGTVSSRRAALQWAERLRGRERQASHDIGFLFQYGAVLGWRTVGEPFLRDLGLAAADRLVAMWHPRARVIPVGSHAEVSSGVDDVTIDCLMNLQVLWWAASETGDARYRDIAVAHAERTAAWHVRADGACDQSVHFDPATGEPYKKHTHQGYSPDGCWARGLGWCAYGFLEAHRATGRGDFLEIARRALEYHVHRTPADPVTFNDYDDPRIPAAPRDTSAAAILAAAAIELGHLTGEERFRLEGDRILEALIRGYLTPVDRDDARPPGMLLHGCYNLYSGEAPDHELVWGDYFLLEALLRRRGRAPR